LEVQILIKSQVFVTITESLTDEHLTQLQSELIDFNKISSPNEK